MKITHNQLHDAFVLEVDLGEVPVWEFDYGEVKLYPDTESGVRQAKFRVPEVGSADWCYFVHAFNTVQREVSPECNMILRVAGREYSLFGALDGLPAASMTREGLVSFPEGCAPSLQALSGGASASLSVTLPQVRSVSIGGNQGRNEAVSGVFSPIIPGTEVRGFFYKGQKRVSTGNAIRVCLPDGTVLLDKHMQQNGHGRGYQDWLWGVLQTAAVEVSLRVVPHQPRGPWGGYLVYPEVRRSFSLPVEGVVFRQEDDAF